VYNYIQRTWLNIKIIDNQTSHCNNANICDFLIIYVTATISTCNKAAAARHSIENSVGGLPRRLKYVVNPVAFLSSSALATGSVSDVTVDSELRYFSNLLT